MSIVVVSPESPTPWVQLQLMLTSCSAVHEVCVERSSSDLRKIQVLRIARFSMLFFLTELNKKINTDKKDKNCNSTKQKYFPSFVDKPIQFPVKFRQAANYPVDLYFLMDLSRSMKDDQEKTAELAATLGKFMETAA